MRLKKLDEPELRDTLALTQRYGRGGEIRHDYSNFAAIARVNYTR
jgi:hypothetical protein